MRKIRRGLLILLAALMVLTLAACKSNDNGGEGSSKGYLYSMETLPLPEGLNYVDCFGYSNGYVYIAYSGYEENTTAEAEAEPVTDETADEAEDEAEGEENYDVTYWRKMAKMDISGGEWTEIPYEPESEDSYISSIEPNEDGTIWIFETTYEYEYDENGDIISSENTYLLEKISETGEVLDTVDLNYLNGESGEYFYIERVLSDDEGNWYFSCNADTGTFISVTDSAGTELFRLESENYIERVIKTSAGDIAVSVYNWESEENYGYELTVIDTGSKDWGKKYSIESNNATLYNGLDYYAYLNDNTNLYGYDAENGSKTVLLNWVENNINSSNMQYLQPISDTQILCAAYDYSNDGYSVELTLLTKTDNEPGDQEVITLGGIGISDDIKSAVIEFNKANEEYRISITDYMTDDDYTAAIDSMNTAILAGNIPDILVMNNYSVTPESYIAKGLLEDLYPYIDKDEEIAREDFVQGVLRVMEKDGSLYEIIDGFSVITLVGKSEVVGTEMGWTIEDLYSLLEANPDADYPLGNYYTQNDLLYSFFSYCSNDYINWSTGECSFESEEFIKLLELAATLPSDYPEDEDAPIEPELIMDGRQLLVSGYISGTDNLQYYKAVFGGDITFIGFPVSEGVGNALQYNQSLAISSKSQYKDTAWEFIRTFLLEEHQKKLSEWSWMFPVMQTYLDSYMNDALGRSDEIISTWGWGDNFEVEIKGPTQEEIDQYMELINSIERVSGYDQSMIEIIQEEASSFFVGDKTAEEVAGIIQNRMETYLNEQR